MHVIRFRPLRRPRARGFAALAGMFALAGCFDITGPGSAENFANIAFGRKVVMWATPDTVGGWTMQPALSATHVYFERDKLLRGDVVTRQAQLVALDRATGAVAWGRPIVTGENAALAGGRVAAVWGALPIFDAASGTPVHTYQFGTTSLNSNVVADAGRFYVGTYTGYAVAVDAATGAEAWRTNLAGPSATALAGLALRGDTLAVAFKKFGAAPAYADSGFVAVLDPGTGAVRWRVAVQGSRNPGIVEPPVIVNGLVVAVTHGHDVRAYDAKTGALRWQANVAFNQDDLANDGLAACDGMVIVPSGDLGLVALDAGTGATLWRRGNLNEGSLSSAQCSHGTVLTLGAGLRVFNSATGAPLATYPRNLPPSWNGRDFWIVAAVRDEQSIYVGTSHGYARIRAP